MVQYPSLPTAASTRLLLSHSSLVTAEDVLMRGADNLCA